MLVDNHAWPCEHFDENTKPSHPCCDTQRARRSAISHPPHRIRITSADCNFARTSAAAPTNEDQEKYESPHPIRHLYEHGPYYPWSARGDMKKWFETWLMLDGEEQLLVDPWPYIGTGLVRNNKTVEDYCSVLETSSGSVVRKGKEVVAAQRFEMSGVNFSRFELRQFRSTYCHVQYFPIWDTASPFHIEPKSSSLSLSSQAWDTRN